MHYSKTLNYLMIGFAFVFPFSVALANSILGLMVVLWIFEGNFQQKFLKIKQEKIIWIFFSIAILILLSSLFSHSISDSFLVRPNKSLYKIIFSHFIWIPMLLVIFITSIKFRTLDKITSAFLVSIFISELISYLIYFHLIDLEYLQSLHLLYHNAAYENPTPFMHHTVYSVFLNISIILLLHKFLTIQNLYIKIFIILFLLSATANLFINGGRTGQIGFILSMLTYSAFYFRFTFQSILLTSVIISTVVFTAYQTSPIFNARANLAINNLDQALNGHYNSSWGVRVASNIVAIDYLFDSPTHFIFGAGVGDARKEYITHANIHFDKNISNSIHSLQHLHNQYLQYWFDGTIFSLLLFLYYFYLMFTLPVQPSFKPLLYAVSLAIMFSGIGDILFFRYKAFFLFLLMSGYFIVLAKSKETSTN